MNRITRLALDNAAITLLLVVALVVAGATAARSLNQQLVPDVEPPQATIVVVYPGASADEVTRSVVEPVENALEQITELEVLAIASTASESFAAITLQAEYGTDQDDIRAEIEDRLADVDLPEGAEEPDIFLFAFNDIPAIQVSVSGAIEEGDLQQLLEDEIVPELEAIDGVSRVSIAGQRDRKVFLDLDMDAMAAEGVTVADIRSLLQANDLSFPAGTLGAGGRVTPLQVSNEITDLEALENLVLKAGGSGNPAAGGGPPGARPAPQPQGPAAPPPPTMAAAPVNLVDGPFPLPAELIAQARLIGLRISDTSDLTPELVQQLDDASPELLARAARSIIGNLPSNAARDAIAADVIAALPEELQQAYEAVTGSQPTATATTSTPATAGEGAGGRRIQVVIVRAGDTTAALAARYGTTQAAIEAENELEPGDDLVVGSIARIPLPEGDELPLTWRLAGAETPAGITPEVYRRVAAAAPEALGQLTSEQLLALPPATIGSLPAAFLARQDDAVRDALVARREGPASATQTADQTTTARSQAEIPDVVRLADVATVRLALDDASTVNRTNGQNSLGLSVLKRQSANTVTVVRAVEDKLEDLKDDLPAFNALEVNTVFEQASFIEESLNGVINEGVLGGAFAILAILLFLHFSVRSTAIIAISIPLSLLTALLLMRLQGLSLNLLTLSGLTIAIGRVVDDSIVVVENIYRNLQNGMRKRDAVLQGTRQVAAAITAATLITVAVFLPVGFIGGLTREFFLPLALTTSYALLASLLVSVTVVPLLAHYFLSAGSLPAPRETGTQRAYAQVLNWALDHRVTTLVLSCLLFILSLGLLRFVPQTFIGGFGEPSLSVTLTMPPGTDLLTTDAVALLVEDVLDADERLETIETTVGGGGAFMGQFAGNDPAKASLVATFAEQDLRFFESLDEDDEPVAIAEDVRAALAQLNDADEIERRLRERLGEEDGLRMADNLRGVLADEAIERGQARLPFEYRVSSQASAGPPGGAFDLQVIGEDEAEVREATQLIVTALRDPEEWDEEGYDVLPDDEDEEESFFDRLFGTDDEDDEDDEAAEGEEEDQEDVKALPIINVASNISEPRRLLAVEVDPASAMARGLTTAQVAFSLRPILEGENVGSVEIVGLDGKRQKIDVDARYPDDLITDKPSLESYLLENSSGEQVRLGDVAAVALRDGAVQVTRVDGERAAIISGEVLDDDLFGITASAMRIVDRVRDDNRALFGDDDDEDKDRPIVVRTGTASAEQQEGFGDLVGALPVSALIAYVIMVLEFGSLVVPFIILFSLPFAATGALFALVVTQRALSISSLIGMLLLIGIVVTNAIVLLDFVQRLRRQGMGAREALVEGGRTRLRPILMTAVATVLALIPLSLGFTEGALIASELATVVIGGLVTSTVLTLLVVPVVYSLLGDATRPTGAPREDDPPEPPGGLSPDGSAGPSPAPGALSTTPPRTPGEAEWPKGTSSPPNPAAGAADDPDAPRTPGEDSPFWD